MSSQPQYPLPQRPISPKGQARIANTSGPARNLLFKFFGTNIHSVLNDYAYAGDIMIQHDARASQLAAFARAGGVAMNADTPSGRQSSKYLIREAYTSGADDEHLARLDAATKLGIRFHSGDLLQAGTDDREALRKIEKRLGLTRPNDLPTNLY